MTDDRTFSSRSTPREAFQRLGTVPTLAVTALGLGFMRPASGTWGSLPPAIVAAALILVEQPGWIIDVCLVLLVAIGSVACLRFGRASEATWGRKDPGEVVADEVAGQAVTLLGVPWVSVSSWTGSVAPIEGWPPRLTDLGLVAAGFLLFRIFDILKPPPANGLQRLGGGAGILVDDLIAGAMAAVVLQIGARLLLGG